MHPRKRRLWYLALVSLFLGGATLVVLTTLNDHLLFFMMPTDVLTKKPTMSIRLGGLVEEGSLQRHEKSFSVTFRVTDGQHSIPVWYQGIVPDLFREGQGVVAEGILLKEGVFQATRLLAKHDEKYMPRDVAEALKANGQWRPPVQERRP
ncbi:MAG: cytochrome c biosis protein CcmE [Alphaproteobacteria bacterium]|jgi:cytochrome c-type biogenesis protein CcmE|nr:cytochrome c biosis protein CcmE [Alphaproteobacteria bacterium]MDF3034214.1 cytochrome c biosis protein CcmE [Alphaproteobacteria bacterium]